MFERYWRKENIKLREEMRECKLFVSTHISNISKKDPSVTKGDDVAIETIANCQPNIRSRLLN